MNIIEFLLRILFAYLVFRLITADIYDKDKNTSHLKGRWFASILSGIAIFTSSGPPLDLRIEDSFEQRAYVTLLGAIGYYLIGYIVGYIWQKYKQRNRSNEDLKTTHDLFCTECGIKIKPQSNFCFKCGSKLN
jgi:hypothetical protein